MDYGWRVAQGKTEQAVQGILMLVCWDLEGHPEAVAAGVKEVFFDVKMRIWIYTKFGASRRLGTPRGRRKRIAHV